MALWWLVYFSVLYKQLLKSCFLLPLDTIWISDSLQAKDSDGAITFTDLLLNQMVDLILKKSVSDLSAENVMTIETLLLTVFDMYWHSEVKIKDAIAELIGDQYIQCLNHLYEILGNYYGEYTCNTDTF